MNPRFIQMSSKMFTGTVRIKVCEATGLRPTDFQRRHNMTFGKPDEQLIDPYVSIDVDENHLGKFQVDIVSFFLSLAIQSLNLKRVTSASKSWFEQQKEIRKFFVWKRERERERQ